MAKNKDVGDSKTRKRAGDRRTTEPESVHTPPDAVKDKPSLPPGDSPPIESEVGADGAGDSAPPRPSDDAGPDTVVDDSADPSHPETEDERPSIPTRLCLEIKKRCVFLGVPVADVPPNNYRTNRVDMGTLSNRQRQAYAMLFHGSYGNTLDNGRTVGSPPDSLRLFFELLADEIGLPKALDPPT